MNIRTTILSLASLAVSATFLTGAGIPDYVQFSDDGHLLTTGGMPATGFYDETIVRDVYLVFKESNFWTQLTNNYGTDDHVLADLTVDGETYYDVGVQFKGFTSYSHIGNSEKKSFDIKIDYVNEDQDIMGYDTLNFNNAYEDPSFMREVIYCNLSTNHIPSAKGNFINLYINGENWGVYANIQQLDKDFLKEWFTDEDGPRWRAESSGSSSTSFGGPGGGGPGGGFGNGTSALNYISAESEDYQAYYTLKSGPEETAWEQLKTVCDVLNNTPDESLVEALSQVMDVDRALWFLADEIIFADDDSYVNKGGTDYMIYINPDTNLLTPLEYDGNSSFNSRGVSWSPFYNADNANFPLLYRLLNNSELRQRYLAHFRTILEESFTLEAVQQKVEVYDAMIDELVSADPKKIYTYNNYLQGVEYFADFVEYRTTYLLTDEEVATTGVGINDVVYSTNGQPWVTPEATESVTVTATVGDLTQIQAVYLYYLVGFEGIYQKVQMLDDGLHGDGVAGDGVFGVPIPPSAAGSYVRFYVETVANDEAGTRVYAPAGATHNTYVYRVNVSGTDTAGVVINEIMASNKTTASDEAGDFDDWVELLNNSILPVTLDGCYLSDNYNNPDKWQLPTVTLQPGQFLIVWADDDEEQGDFHASFKLSADGEELLLSNADGSPIDYVAFDPQEEDVSYGRSPNGTGAFTTLTPTFGAINP